MALGNGHAAQDRDVDVEGDGFDQVGGEVVDGDAICLRASKDKGAAANSSALKVCVARRV